MDISNVDTTNWLNTDIRRSKHKPVLPKLLSQSLSGPLHLQIVSVRDTTRPSIERLDLADENTILPSETTVKRILLLHATDGHTEIKIIELQYCSQLKKSNLPPGTKITLLGNMEVENNMVLICPSNIQIKGGLVPHLVQKWIVSNSKLDPFLMGMVGSGKSPPPFVKFDVTLHSSLVDTNVTTKKKKKTMKLNESKTIVENEKPGKALGKVEKIIKLKPLSKSKSIPKDTLPNNTTSPSIATSHTYSCRAVNLVLKENEDHTTANLFFELQLINKDTELKKVQEKEIQLSTSHNLKRMLLGLNQKGAPPFEKLWKSKKGKKYLNDRVERLKKGLLTNKISMYTLDGSFSNKSTIMNIA